MAFERLRLRLRDRFAITEPAVAEIPTEDLAGGYAAIVAIGEADALLMSQAATTLDLARLDTSLVPGDLSLAKAYAEMSSFVWRDLVLPGVRSFPVDLL